LAAAGLSLLVLSAVAATAPAASGSRSAPGSLDLNVTLQMDSPSSACPAGLPPDAECRARTGRGLVPGLGSVIETYAWFFTLGPPNCPPDLGKPLATTGRLAVSGKGEITFTIAAGAQCVDQEPIRNQPQDFSITGGTGLYQGASGGGTLARNLSGGRGIEEGTGTLIVPGLDFDLTPPKLSGVFRRTIRAPKGAKRVRVTYHVSATDDVDGPVPVTCLPRTGSRFPLGRTTVTCEATDKSANNAHAAFVVTVRKP